MSSNHNPQPSIGPMDAGNVVSAALRIYRHHFKSYYLQTLLGFLWSIVPFYGWAKFTMIIAAIARQAFSEVNEQPEVLTNIKSELDRRKWSFWIAGLLFSLYFLAAFFLSGILAAILIGIISTFIQGQTGLLIASYLLLGFLGVCFLVILSVWLVSRMFVYELALATEVNLTANESIKRSWELTKGSVRRLQWIVTIAFLVTLPVSFAVQMLSGILQAILLPLTRNAPELSVVYLLLIIVLSVATNALIIPFWQAIKAVVYYDLKTRREGLGLKLRDRLRKN